MSSIVSRLEHRMPPPLWWVVGAALTWLVDRADLDGSPLESSFNDLLGIVLAFAGVGLGASGLSRFSKAGTTSDPHNIDQASALVTDGVFRFTRNPMYLGLVLILCGWAFRLGSVTGLIVGPGFLLAVLTFFQIRPEEKTLKARFGQEYADYASKVRRWI